MLVLSCLLWIGSDPSAQTVDVSGGVTTEFRGGYAPRTATLSSEPAVLLLITPQVDFRWRTRRYNGSLGLGYAPRMQVRWPNRIELQRPLFLHNLYLDYSVTPSRRWTVLGNLGAAVGEVDYTQLNLVLGPQQGALPGAVTQYAVAEFDTVAEGIINRRHSVALNPRLALRTPYGVGGFTDDPLYQLPQQKSAHFGITYAFRGTPVDTLRVATRPGVVDYNNRTTYFSNDTRAIYSRQLAMNLEASVEAGVFGARRLRAQRSLGDMPPESRVFPVGALGLNGRLRSRASHYVDGRFTVGVQGFFDQLRQSVEPRAQFELGLTTTIPPRWTVSLTASTYTPLTRVQRFALDGGSSPDETVYRLHMPVMYAIDYNLLLEFGTIGSLRSSHWGVEDFRTSWFEAWGYVAFRFAMGTARGNGEVSRDVRDQTTIANPNATRGGARPPRR